MIADILQAEAFKRGFRLASKIFADVFADRAEVVKLLQLFGINNDK